jgi:TIR domain
MADPNPDQPTPMTVFVIDGSPTLPLYVAWAKVVEEIPPLGRGTVNLEYRDPDYESPPYRMTPEWLNRIGREPETAKEVVSGWTKHTTNYRYYMQFKDDERAEKGKLLHDHTALISALCDARLNMDTAGLWEAFDSIVRFGMVHSEYRADARREEKYGQYAEKLKSVHEGSRLNSHADARLLSRILRQIDLKAAVWATLPPIHHATTPQVVGRKVRLFYSYSHRDELLRNKLEDHLAVLKRNGVIENWHDRKIGAGNEWKGAIDSHLEAADVILLLVSSSFISSDYCYDIEMKRAMERHEQGSAKVIPVILKECVWQAAPFGKLLALPTDGKAVTSWRNRDRAFTDIAKGLSYHIRQMTKPT